MSDEPCEAGSPSSTSGPPRARRDQARAARGRYPCEITVAGPTARRQRQERDGRALLCGSMGTVVEVRARGARRRPWSRSASSSPTASGSRSEPRAPRRASRGARRSPDLPASPSARRSSRPRAPSTPRSSPERGGRADVSAVLPRTPPSSAPQRDLHDMANASAIDGAEGSILEAYVLMVGDEALADAVSRRIERPPLRRVGGGQRDRGVAEPPRRGRRPVPPRAQPRRRVRRRAPLLGSPRSAATRTGRHAAPSTAPRSSSPTTSRRPTPRRWSTSRSSASSPRSARARATPRSWRARSRSRRWSA